jgi:gliding motility-associated-like protein
MIFPKTNTYLKYWRLTILVALVCLGGNAFAQCNLDIPDYACVDELVSMSYTTTGAVSNVSWTFGDGSSSIQNSPVHRYGASGMYTVKIVITYNDGTTCEKTKDIEVFDPPNDDVSISSESVFCLSDNKICLLDNSTSSSPRSTITKRVVLWGDGNRTDTDNPTKGSKVCYTYAKTGSYTITVEWTDSKGCKVKKELNVNIKQDFEPTFSIRKGSSTCDYVEFCFTKDTVDWDMDEVLSVTYDFADGNTADGTNTLKICHKYTHSGIFNVFITVKLKNGCEVRYNRFVNVDVDLVNIDHRKLDSIKCFPGYFEFAHDIVKNADFRWSVASDTLLGPWIEFGNARNAFLFPQNPGKYFIKLKIVKNGCISEMLYDSVESVGIKANALIRNGNQCDNQDTVYFCGKPIAYDVGNISHFWDFNDVGAAQCTRKEGDYAAIKDNCNFSENQESRHLFSESGCFTTLYKLKEDKHGCEDSSEYTVQLDQLVKEDLAWEVNKHCIGQAPEYTFRFDLDECRGEVFINLDSACGKNLFFPYRTYHNYTKTCGDSNWVTLGMLTKTGDVRVWTGCGADDFYIDSSRLCVDTFWYHRAFRLENSPTAHFSITADSCAPAPADVQFNTPVQENVRSIFYNWGDGQTEYDKPTGREDSLPVRGHIYQKAGIYDVEIVMASDSGCSNRRTETVQIGYFNTFTGPSVVCPGTTVRFRDSVKHWNSFSSSWRDTTLYSDTGYYMIWDLDDGMGFHHLGPLPSRTFDKEGEYTIRMATRDNNGCTDTAELLIMVSRISAGIESITKKIVCDDILQFFDSSEVLSDLDSIVLHYWDFGDGKTPSYLENPFHFYSTYGEFTITHVVENISGCRDTAFLTINIDGPLPHFDIIGDTVGCAPFTAEFKNNSVNATDYIWYFGDASSSNNTLSTKSKGNVSFTYLNPGTYYIYLFAGDSVVNPDNNNNIYYCSATFPDSTAPGAAVRRVIVLPIPQVDFEAEGNFCVGQSLLLSDASDDRYEQYRWYIGEDSIFATEEDISYTFDSAGSYTIDYRPRYTPIPPYEKNCFDSMSKTFEINEHTISFDFVQDSICPEFTFTTDASKSASILWDFGHPQSGDSNSSQEAIVLHNFAPETGIFNVCLYSEGLNGCKDTLCTEVESVWEFTLFIPNIIIPDGDGLNDVLDIQVDGEDHYELFVYNRYGERVFYQNSDAQIGSGLNWDGTVDKTGRPLPAGTYFYVFRFKEACVPDAPMEEYSGQITLIR